MERINKLYIVIGAVIAIGLFFAITANADESDEAMTVTFSTPVQIPGKVLPAGSYLFKLADDGSDPNVVEILNSDGARLYEMVTTRPIERQESSDKTTITFAQQGPGKPDALLKWYYPASLVGHEFIYPVREDKALRHDTQQTIAAGPNATTAEAEAAE